MANKLWNYNNPAEYTYDSSKIEVSEGLVKLKSVATGKEPVGHWHFNEEDGIIAIDSSAYGNTGTLYGRDELLPLRELGKLGNGLNFNGNSYVSIVNSASINITGSISLECWVKIHTDGTYKGIIGKNYSASYMLSTGNEGDRAISFFYGAWQLIAVDAFILDTWHHVVATFDKDTSTAVLYVDNVVVAANTEPFTPAPVGDETVLCFGIQPYTDWDYVLDGSLDEVLIYNTALTPEEVAYKFNLGNGREELFPPSYATDKPFVQPTELFHIDYIQSYQDFLEILGAGNEGQIKYTLSNDGINWFYWNGLDWTTPAEENSNTLEEISENIGTFPLTFDFTFRAHLISNGTQKVELDENGLSYNISIIPINDWDSLVNDHTIVGSFGELIKDMENRLDLIKIETDKIDSIITTLSTLVVDIWNYTSRALTDFGTLISDIATTIWSSLTRTLTEGTKDSEIDAIKLETDKIQPEIIEKKNEFKADVSDLALETTSQSIKETVEGLDLELDGVAKESTLETKASQESVDAIKIEVDKIELIKQMETGKWKIISNQMIFYKDDNTTEIARFNLFDKDGIATMTDAVERQKV